MTTKEQQPLVPSPSQDQLKETIEAYEKMLRMDAKLVGPDGKTEYLPSDLYSFLCQLLATLTSGKSVTILQPNLLLTTVEAAKLLGVSRQFLIDGILEKNLIPFFKTGSHRRIYARDVLAYKLKRDTERLRALDDLSRTEKEQGLYDLMPDDFDTGQ
jgi:excisionase family DNA binding protein